MRNICGIDIDLEKKNVKRLRLRVLPPDGRVKLSVPRRIKNAEIEAFVLSRREWILESQRIVSSRSENGSIGYNEGDTVFIWGRAYILHLEHGSRNSLIVEENGTAVLTMREDAGEERRKSFVREWYRRELTDAAAPLIKKWAAETGLYPREFMTKDMKTRWGSCNTREKRIWLNVRLAQHPLQCLEYVILHELAHLSVPNHGADFYAILDRYMPDWQQRKELLNRG